MSNISDVQVAKFSKDSARWWEEDGPFKPLHRLNPLRIAYIKDHIILDHQQSLPQELSVLDIGCGGGIVCEPLARLGATVTGVDADEKAVTVARSHAAEWALSINYVHGTAEEVEQQYDVVLALEIIEHVPDAYGFVQSCFNLCKPGGKVIFSTLNRTLKSYMLGIIAAEYLLGWVPKGTHNWRKFIKPSELRRFVHASGGAVHDVTGLIYSPINDDFYLDKKDVDINYFLTASKK